MQMKLEQHCNCVIDSTFESQNGERAAIQGCKFQLKQGNLIQIFFERLSLLPGDLFKKELCWWISESLRIQSFSYSERILFPLLFPTPLQELLEQVVDMKREPEERRFPFAPVPFSHAVQSKSVCLLEGVCVCVCSIYAVKDG